MSRASFIFDSHALLKFFQKEKGYEKVFRLLEEIKKSGATKYINAINLGEIIYSTKREFGDQRKIEVLAHIERLHFTILPVPNNLISQAAEYKSQYAISLRRHPIHGVGTWHHAISFLGRNHFEGRWRRSLTETVSGSVMHHDPVSVRQSRK